MFSDNDNLKDFVKEDFIPETEMDPPRAELFFYNLIDSENISKLMNDSDSLRVMPQTSFTESFADYAKTFDEFIVDWDSKI